MLEEQQDGAEAAAQEQAQEAVQVAAAQVAAQASAQVLCRWEGFNLQCYLMILHLLQRWAPEYTAPKIAYCHTSTI
jgi:hypothetical protein